MIGSCSSIYLQVKRKGSACDWMGLWSTGGLFFTPEFSFLVSFCQFLRFYRQIFSSWTFFYCRHLMYDCMFKCHDMTSKWDVMAWNDIITSEHLPVYLEFFLKREPTLITKTPQRFLAKQWCYDISMTSCHDILNTDYFTTLLSPEIDVMEQSFFKFLRLFGSRKSMAYGPDTWPWRMTLYVKVTWSYKWPVSSWAVYMLEAGIFFVSMVCWVKKVKGM